MLISQGPSIAFIDFKGLQDAASNANYNVCGGGSSNCVNSNIVMSQQALSNNDLADWITGTAGVTPDACLTATGGGNTNPAACLGTTLPGNEFDRSCNGLPVSNRSCAQVQVLIIDQSNGRVHVYSNGCIASGSGSTTVYKQCLSLPASSSGCAASPAHDPNTGNDCIADPAKEQVYDTTNTVWALGQEMRASSSRFPHVKLAFFTGRAFAGYSASQTADPEPFAYEKALAIKYLIHAQICEEGGDGCTLGTIDAVAGDLCPLAAGCGGGTVANSSPFLLWADVQAAASDDGVIHSAYLWGNGTSARVEDQFVAGGSSCTGTNLFITASTGSTTGSLVPGSNNCGTGAQACINASCPLPNYIWCNGQAGSPSESQSL